VHPRNLVRALERSAIAPPHPPGASQREVVGMGRAKKAKGSARRVSAAKDKDSVKAAGAEDVGTLLASAEDALDRMEHTEALELLHRARDAEAAGAAGEDRAASRLGELLADVGRVEEAVGVLLDAAQRCPDSGHEKFMYLGQLVGRRGEARRWLARGTALLRARAEGAHGEEAGELRAQLGRALCAAAELELRSCAEAESDEGRDAAAAACDALLRDALAVDGDSPDPHQVLCSLRIEQGRREEAGRALQACTERTDAALLAAGVPGLLGSAQEPPSVEFRYENAKLLLELGRPGRAARTLELLVEECDDNPDVWYLLGLAYHLKEDREAAAECLGHAQRALGAFPDAGGGEESETGALVRELLEEVEEASVASPSSTAATAAASWRATWAENNVPHSALGPDPPSDEEDEDEEGEDDLMDT